MLTLAIEMSNPGPTPSMGESAAVPRGGIALGIARQATDPEILASQSVGPVESLAATIAALLQKADAAPGDLERVAVSLGPGGFTSLRISVMTAKLIAEATGAQCVGVPTGDAVRRRVVPPSGITGPIVIALAWKRTDVWCAEYDVDSLAPRGESGLVSVDDLGRRALGGTLIADSRLLQLVSLARAPGRHLATAEPSFDPVAVLELAADVSPVDPVELAPIYPRPPEAVRKWREKSPPA